MGDKVFNMGVGFFITVFVARHLGPEDFGLFSYVVSITAMFSAAGHMGLGGLVVREIVNNPDERGVILGTTLGLRFIGMTIGYCMLMIYAMYYEGFLSQHFLLLSIAGLSLFINSFEVIDFWFQAFVKARYSTISRLSGLFFGSLLKIVFLISGVSVLFFVISNVIQALFVALVFIFIYLIKEDLSIREWRFSSIKAKELFGQGWVIYLGTLLSVIYLKVDQVMLRWLDGSESVGIYALAAQLSEAWYFVPAAIVTSVFPKLIKIRSEDENEFKRRFQQLLDLLLLAAIAIAIASQLHR